MLEMIGTAKLTISDSLINGGGITNSISDKNFIIAKGNAEILVNGIFINGYNINSLALLELNNNSMFKVKGDVVNGNINIAAYASEV